MAEKDDTPMRSTHPFLGSLLPFLVSCFLVCHRRWWNIHIATLFQAKGDIVIQPNATFCPGGHKSSQNTRTSSRSNTDISLNLVFFPLVQNKNIKTHSGGWLGFPCAGHGNSRLFDDFFLLPFSHSAIQLSWQLGWEHCPCGRAVWRCLVPSQAT